MKESKFYNIIYFTACGVITENVTIPMANATVPIPAMKLINSFLGVIRIHIIPI